MKSLMSLALQVLADCGHWCCISTTRDRKTIVRRVEHEGVSFLTICLPAFCDDFQKSLAAGKVADDHFLGFTRSGGLPRFLGGFLQLVFDRETGCLLDEPSTDAIWAIRQITLLCGKVLIPCSDARTLRAIGGFVECEKDVKNHEIAMSRDNPEFYRAFQDMAMVLWADVFAGADYAAYQGDMVPRHGPGATADRLRGNAKWRQTEWPERLEEMFPSGEYLLPNWRFLSDLSVNFLEPGAERPVRVIPVPKTLKTPRIIAIEPTCMQYVQQAVKAALLESFERDNYMPKFVGFKDQTPNQRMALEGSLLGNLATLDLSEASDRVSNQLVRSMLSRWPHLARAVEASRSRKADVPGEIGALRLSKFASMGSALCFPIEAMVFTTIIFLGLQDELRRPIRRRDLFRYVGQVRVYGDDIVIPLTAVPFVVARLESFGFRVNRGKSFWTGKFRESCGKEYYGGVDVSIVRMRMLLPTQRTDAQQIVSAVSLRNQCYFAGLWGVARWLDEYLGRLITFPNVLPTSAVLGRHSYLGYETQKLCPDLQIPLVKGLVVSNVLPESHLEGYAALVKCLVLHSDLPIEDRDHLERSGRPRSVNTKTRWASAV